jgi:hypothetical protein
MDFVEGELESVKDTSIILDGNDVFSCFKAWAPDNAPHIKSINKKTCLQGVSKIVGTGNFKKDGQTNIKLLGYRFRSKHEIQDELD